jgi:hypothetical protein
MKIYEHIFCFVMGDLYLFFEKYFMYFYNYYILLFKQYQLPFSLTKVEVKTKDKLTDITNDYINNPKWSRSFHEDSLVYITWSYLHKTYKYVYPINNPIEFPPYTIEQLRVKPNKKIISVSYINEDEKVIKLIKQYMGPMHNFYSDKYTENMKLSWITDKQIDQLTIIDNFGNFSQIESNNLKLT